jgi:hypothetical protein
MVAQVAARTRRILAQLFSFVTPNSFFKTIGATLANLAGIQALQSAESLGSQLFDRCQHSRSFAQRSDY